MALNIQENQLVPTTQFPALCAADLFNPSALNPKPTGQGCKPLGDSCQFGKCLRWDTHKQQPFLALWAKNLRT